MSVYFITLTKAVFKDRGFILTKEEAISLARDILNYYGVK